MIGSPPIINHGTGEQKQKWLPGLFDFEMSFCLGITEPSGGSDVANIQTTAKKTPDGKSYVVTNIKVDYGRTVGNSYDDCGPYRWKMNERHLRTCDPNLLQGFLVA